MRLASGMGLDITVIQRMLAASLVAALGVWYLQGTLMVNTHRFVLVDGAHMGSFRTRNHVSLPPFNREWPLDHVGNGGQYCCVCAVVHLRVGFPHRRRLPVVLVVHWLILADWIHDATQQCLMRTDKRSVKGRRR